jgi:nucleoside-diphosphate-sugar epimerase
MTVLVTGAGGFVGRHLTAGLRADGIEVVTAGVSASRGRHYRLSDVTSAAENGEVLRAARPDRIYHLAGVASSAEPEAFYRVNVGFSAAVAAAAEREAAEAVLLLLGTAAEYGEAEPRDLPLRESHPCSPRGDYGVSKLRQTALGVAAARRGMKVLLPRAFNIIGPDMPRHTALGDFARQIAEIEAGQRPASLKVGNLAGFRDFIDVRDLVLLLRRMAELPRCFGRIVNLCSGRATRMADVVEQLVAASSLPIRIEVDPRRYKPVDVPVSYGSTELMGELVGSAPEVDWPKLCREMLAAARAGLAGRPEEPVRAARG